MEGRDRHGRTDILIVISTENNARMQMHVSDISHWEKEATNAYAPRVPDLRGSNEGKKESKSR